MALRPANMDRVNGWAEIMSRFGEPQCGIQPGSTPDDSANIRPTLFIHQRCGRLIETLPALQHDPNRPEDVDKIDADEDGVGGDDAADCLRYLVATKARQIVERKLRGLRLTQEVRMQQGRPQRGGLSAQEARLLVVMVKSPKSICLIIIKPGLIQNR